MDLTFLLTVGSGAHFTDESAEVQIGYTAVTQQGETQLYLRRGYRCLAGTSGYLVGADANRRPSGGKALPLFRIENTS